MPHYTTFPQFTQRPDYFFSICVHWSEELQHYNLFRCRINKPIMLWMAHSFSKRVHVLHQPKINIISVADHILEKDYEDKCIFSQRTEIFMLNHWEASIFWQTKQRNTAERARGFKRDAILLLNFNISCAGDTEWAHLPKKPSSITGNEVVCLIMLYRVGESQRQGAGYLESSQETRENSHFLFCRVPFRFRSGQSCKTSELWANHFYFSIIYILLKYLFTIYSTSYIRFIHLIYTVCVCVCVYI